MGLPFQRRYRQRLAGMFSSDNENEQGGVAVSKIAAVARRARIDIRRRRAI